MFYGFMINNELHGTANEEKKKKKKDKNRYKPNFNTSLNISLFVIIEYFPRFTHTKIVINVRNAKHDVCRWQSLHKHNIRNISYITSTL